MLKLFKITFLFILFSISASFSQRNVFVWGEGLTEYTGKFDTTKFKLEEIETIYNYLCENHGELFTIGNIWKIGQMDTATTKIIDDYYFKTRHILRTMKIPDGQFWDGLRGEYPADAYFDPQDAACCCVKSSQCRCKCRPLWFSRYWHCSRTLPACHGILSNSACKISSAWSLQLSSATCCHR